MGDPLWCVHTKPLRRNMALVSNNSSRFAKRLSNTILSKQ